MHPYNCSSSNTTHCHQAVLVPWEESGGAISTPGEAACSPAALNAAGAPALSVLNPK